jgi:hypothetical protein
MAPVSPAGTTEYSGATVSSNTAEAIAARSTTSATAWRTARAFAGSGSAVVAPNGWVSRLKTMNWMSPPGLSTTVSPSTARRAATSTGARSRRATSMSPSRRARLRFSDAG